MLCHCVLVCIRSAVMEYELFNRHYYDYLNHKGYKSKQYSRGNVLMPGRFLTTTSDAFVSYVTAYDFIHQPEGCIDVDRPLWRDLRERTMEDDNPILLLYYIRK